MPAARISEILEAVTGTFSGDADLEIRRVRSLADAGPGELSFLSNAKYEPLLRSTGASAVLVSRTFKGEADESRLIRVDDPYLALSIVVSRWFVQIPAPGGVSPMAAVSASATIGSHVGIGAFASIGDDVVIEDHVTIYEGSVIGAGSVIGRGTIIYPNATLYHGTKVGERCIIHSGVVLGADGYGFATAAGRHNKIPQIGIVRIENDVEIGAGTTVDRAALGETVIGEGTKIDNLVQVGHNVRIGKHCLVVSQVAFAGSAEVGDYCVFGGQSGVSGHVRLGSRVMVAAQAAVMKDWEGPVTLAGNPARPIRDRLRAEALIKRLPALMNRLQELESKSARETEDPGVKER
ncbi:MAG TPA: UDP-3-O-(3-hydroxymyristoyl)glucosamine N-acyltransferase [Thermoanaerobaculia bacterium]|nr:UDP-3-O-(3-hydroxymyristoyl)glucosamine N-acyltransferase [Thermoanaerobaculia bacterium]